MNHVKEGSVALVAFGGNALVTPGQQGTFAQQRQAANEMCSKLLSIIQQGYELVVTHGNAPQVGNLLIQRDLTRQAIPELPLDVLVAQTEGWLGYLLQQELLNYLRAKRAGKYVVTMITQVLVDKDDPAFGKPIKPVGPFYSKEQVHRILADNPDWQMTEQFGKGYRRVVPSPEPRRILQSHMIRSLVYSGNVVIALGGGGIAMIKNGDGQYLGVEAVIDKDLSSSLLAGDIKADLFILLTGVPGVCLNYGRPDEKPLDTLKYSQAADYMRAGHFPPGSMGPKITAALRYIEQGGHEALITNAANLEKALAGHEGTHIIAD
jgi:carbamate kinase